MPMYLQGISPDFNQARAIVVLQNILAGVEEDAMGGDLEAMKVTEVGLCIIMIQGGNMLVLYICAGMGTQKYIRIHAVTFLRTLVHTEGFVDHTSRDRSCTITCCVRLGAATCSWVTQIVKGIRGDVHGRIGLTSTWMS